MWVRFVVGLGAGLRAVLVARAASLLVVLEVVYSVTDPPIKALRRVIPPLRIGNYRARPELLLVVLIGAYVLLRVNRATLLLA